METLKNLKFYLFYLSQFYLDNLYLLFSDYMEIIYLDNYPGGNPSFTRTSKTILLFTAQDGPNGQSYPKISFYGSSYIMYMNVMFVIF